MYSIPNHLAKKYSVIGPRYTSYPTAPTWSDIDNSEHLGWLEDNRNSQRELSLYIHIPFCRERCLYCGCNVVITRQQSASKDYLTYILKEIDSLGKYRDGNKKIAQLHFGGGTPNFLLNEEFEQIMEALNKNFHFTDDSEIGIEIDPCTTRPQQLDFLTGIGVNRLSLGVQDFDTRVQEAVNRVQSKEITLQHLQKARSLGIQGINFDLIYGLPYQTVKSFQETVDAVIEMRPDRLAVYNFGYLPEKMIHQRKIKPDMLPDLQIKMDILLDTINRFSQAGYRYIGMDHFALPEDELSKAQVDRTLYRNFMGYTPKSDVDLYGIGVTSISEFEDCFIQNQKRLKDYKKAIEENGIAGSKGIKLSADDKKRKWTIMKLICHFHLDFNEFEESFGVSFQENFSPEMERLNELESDGLIRVEPDCIKVIDHGQIIVRNVCMVFDSYLAKPDQPKVKYSNTL